MHPSKDHFISSRYFQFTGDDRRFGYSHIPGEFFFVFSSYYSSIQSHFAQSSLFWSAFVFIWCVNYKWMYGGMIEPGSCLFIYIAAHLCLCSKPNMVPNQISGCWLIHKCGSFGRRAAFDWTLSLLIKECFEAEELMIVQRNRWDG